MIARRALFTVQFGGFMTQRHILLLDPNAGNRRNLAFLLHLAGYAVTEVAAADEALNRLSLSTEGRRPDLLLACEGDPGLNLPRVLAQLAQQRDGILVVTGSGPDADGREMPQIFSHCRRNEVIETLARHWAGDKQPSSPHSISCPAIGE